MARFFKPFAKVENVFGEKVIQFGIFCLGCPQKTSNVSISGEDQLIKHACVEFCDTRHHKGPGGCNFAIMSYFFDGSYPDDICDETEADPGLAPRWTGNYGNRKYRNRRYRIRKYCYNNYIYLKVM